MKFSVKDTKEFVIAGGTQGNIFPSHPMGEQTIVSLVMDGVYPMKGYSINSICTETIYVIEGSLRVTLNETEYTVNAGDLIMVLPNTRYSVRGNAKALDIITPKWDAKQNRIIHST